MAIPQVDVATLKGWQKDGEDVTIIDVREDWEWNEGHIPGAIHMPLHVLHLKIGERDISKDTRIVCNCRSGGRSSTAVKTLQDMGYTNVHNLTGGYLAYSAS